MYLGYVSLKFDKETFSKEFMGILDKYHYLSFHHYFLEKKLEIKDNFII